MGKFGFGAECSEALSQVLLPARFLPPPLCLNWVGLCRASDLSYTCLFNCGYVSFKIDWLPSLYLLRRRALMGGVNEESTELCFPASLSGNSRMAAVALFTWRGGKYRQGARLLMACVPTVLDVHASFM